VRTIAHVSDLHFGKDDPRIVKGLLRALEEAKPDAIVVSGDLTQRAKKKQFRAAKAFLDAMPQVPRVVVPGNHDVSTTNLFERVVRPLKRYQRFIERDLAPFWSDEEIAIAGVNTVRLMSTKDGRINRAQVEGVCADFAGLTGKQVRVVVSHQPLDVPAEDLRHPVVTRAKMAMERFAACGVDLFLSGHLHVGLTLASSVRYPIAGYSAVMVHAGTAVSTRTRKEANGWNLIRVSAGGIEVTRMVWSGKRFAAGAVERYRKGEGGWAIVVSTSGSGLGGN
jgi:3',5'-cyclic AMP phosphodiesterase CpdA